MPRSRRREMRHQVLLALRSHLESAADQPFLPDEGHYPADIADVLWLDFDREEARRLYGLFSEETQAEVLAEAEPRLVEDLLDGIDPETLARKLERIPADDGTDILELVPEEVRQQALCFIEPSDASHLRHLGEYDPETAGGMMTTEFITVSTDERIGDVIKRIKRDEDDAETIHAIYVTDQREVLQGVISSRELLEAGIHDLVGDLMNPDVILARVEEDQEDVAHRLLHYNLSAIPVVDPRGAIVGIVTADDALEVLEGEGSEDALLLAGAGPDSDASETLRSKVLHRAPMLTIPVVAGLVMSRVMNVFAGDLAGGVHASGGESGIGADSLAAIISFIPMVLALAGTVGMQTSAVLVRGFAVGQIVDGKRLRVFMTEVQVGLFLGAICAAIAFPVAAWFVSSDVGTAMAVAMWIAMSWTTFIASGIAMGTEALGKDPAVVAGPLMIAVSDLSAVVIFFLTAELLLSA